MALGVKLARPERPVICVSGDGGFMMNIQEVETAVRYGIGVVNIVLNNNCWGTEKACQKFRYEERYVAADLANPCFDRYAELCGGRASTWSRPTNSGTLCARPWGSADQQ